MSTTIALPKVGDLHKVTIVEVRLVDKKPVETPVTNTFRIEAILKFEGWHVARGTVVATTCAVPGAYMGTQAQAYLGREA